MKKKKWQWFCVVIPIAALIGLWACPISANAESIVAHFDDGNDPNTDDVDTYPGRDGLGWQDGWVTSSNGRWSSTSLLVLEPGEEALGYDEIKDGWENYLDVETTSSSGDARFSVCRDYKDGTEYIDPSKTHVITFTVRINEDVDGEDTLFDGTQDQYNIFDATVARNATHSSVSWVVGVIGAGDYPGEWFFNNGNNLGSDTKVYTGIDAVKDGIYDFTVTVYPETQKWDCTITDGTDSFTNPELMGWRTTATEIGGFLCFNTRATSSGETRDWSIDQLDIVPEPSTGVLMLIGALAGCLFRRSRR